MDGIVSREDTPKSPASAGTHEKMLLALVESASQGIISVDESGRITFVNRKAEQMFGYTREELSGAPIEILIPESMRPAHGHFREEYFQRPRVRPMGAGVDLAGRHKDGTEFPVEVGLSHIETEEGGYGIAIVTDIRPRKQLEEQLLHAQKMEAVGRLAGGVAHDFNNMLTVISGYNRMILQDLSPTDPLRGYAEEVLKAADRAGALTNQLLAFSRRQVIQPRVLNVSTVIARIESMLRRLIGEDIALMIKTDPGVGNIRADPGHVEQALFNLAVNARDAMPTGGHLTFETANVELDGNYVRTHMGEQPGPFVMIAVSDSGQGMDSETKLRIFEPFFTTKQAGLGTGLGLATVYGTVKQAGGNIWVYSEVGKGTTFKLYFPRVEELLDEEPRPDMTPVELMGAETLLVVEDDEAVRSLTVRMLQQLGYNVLVATNGEEALAISGSFSGLISLLVTDVVMPGMSGRQLADVLTLTRPGMQVLYLSGYTENTVIHHGVLDSGVQFLPKPFTSETLARRVREILAASAAE